MQRYHFIGIGGIGMSGLARILLSRNIAVTGSDLASSYITDGLIKAGAKISFGQSVTNIVANVPVVFSSDIKRDNPEFQEAVRLGCPLLHRSDLLVKLIEQSKTLAITGTHGKTTTSSLMASVLKNCGWDPTYIVGGVLQQFQSNAEPGTGEYSVVEADESDGTFLKYHPMGAIITNIDLDHMNYFGSEKALCDQFHQFARQVKSEKYLFWCGDDTRLRSLNLPGISYGIGSHNNLRASNVKQNQWMLQCDVHVDERFFPKVEIALVGQHNVLNALAVFGLGLALGVEERALRNALAGFAGVKRRCDRKQAANDVLVIDDYGHHPTEIATTLRGIRTAIGKRRLVGVFQPHRYSRTQECLGTYGGIFDAVDVLFVTDIFASNEAPIPGVHISRVFDEITHTATFPCHYVPRSELRDAVQASLQAHDVVVTLGAGDITKLSTELCNS